MFAVVVAVACLSLAVTGETPTPPSTSTSPTLTPEQEVEAWTPESDGARERRVVRPKERRDLLPDSIVPAAWGAAGGLVIGATTAYITLALASAVLPGSSAAALAAVGLGLTLVAAAPGLAVWAVGPPQLPAWGPFLVSGLTGVGVVTGAVVGTLSGPPVASLFATPGDDCALCGGPALFVLLAVPTTATIVGAVGGAVGGAALSAAAAE